MYLKVIASALLAATALGGVAQAQTANTSQTTQTDVKKPKAKTTAAAKPAATPATAPVANTAAAPAAPAAQPQRGSSVSGLTASPTDFGTVFAGQGGTGRTPGGVTRTAPGGGYMIEEEVPKTRSTVTRDAIDKLSPTANPYQMVNLLPGANVSSTDAAGMNGGNMTMRGFNSDQIGVTIEGAPVNDSGNYAIYPQEYVDSSNIEQVSIAQGAPDLDSPHIGATGGVMNIYMVDPKKTAGVMTSTTVGSHNLRQQFVRVDSGQIDNVRAMMSFSRYMRDHWSGVGTDNRTHVDGKVVWDLDAGNHIRVSAIYNSALNYFYANPKLSDFNNSGYRPNYNASLTGNAATDTNYAGYKINPFRNLILSAPSDFRITDDIKYDVIPYFWYGFGNGGGVSTMTEDAGANKCSGAGSQGCSFYGNARLTGIDWNGDGKVTAGTKVNYYNPSVTETYRPGIVNKLTWDIKDHKIVAGYWLEVATHKQYGPFQALTPSGGIVEPFLSKDDGFVDPVGAYAGTTLEKRDWTTRTITNVLFLGDTWSLLNDQLKFDYGIKQAFINRTLNNYIPGATPRVTANNMATLPTFGVNYKINPENQIFASAVTTFRTTPNYALADGFNQTTGAQNSFGTGSQKPERAITGEIGHRYQGDIFLTSISAFGTRYLNRQVQTNVLDPFGNFDSTYVNAGGAWIYGIDAEISTRPVLGGLRPYASMELLKTQLTDNLLTSGTLGGKTIVDYLPTRNKELPRAPNFTGAIGLDWDDGHILGNLAFKYVGSQYSTFVNDEKIPGYGRVDAMIGYRFDNVTLGEKKDALKAPEIKLNLYNIANSRQLTGVSSVQTNANAATGINGSTISGSAPQYYMGEGFAAMVTFKAAF